MNDSARSTTTTQVCLNVCLNPVTQSTLCFYFCSGIAADSELAQLSLPYHGVYLKNAICTFDVCVRNHVFSCAFCLFVATTVQEL